MEYREAYYIIVKDGNKTLSSQRVESQAEGIDFLHLYNLAPGETAELVRMSEVVLATRP